MKKLLIVLLIFLTNQVAANFTLCNSKFALCTTALCPLLPGEKNQVACRCDVTE